MPQLMDPVPRSGTHVSTLIDIPADATGTIFVYTVANDSDLRDTTKSFHLAIDKREPDGSFSEAVGFGHDCGPVVVNGAELLPPPQVGVSSPAADLRGKSIRVRLVVPAPGSAQTAPSVTTGATIDLR